MPDLEEPGRYVVRWTDPADGYIHRATYRDPEAAEALEADLRVRGMRDIYAVRSG